MHEIRLDRFKNGTKSIVTMSFDDGQPNDKRLIELFDKYGIKGTFHLISGRELLPSETYKGHEVSCHTVNHTYMNMITPEMQYREWRDNRIALEKYCGYRVQGGSYPYGIFNDEIIAAAKLAGIVYSRTTKNTDWFSFPDNFMMWHPTCHFKNAAELADSFVKRCDVAWSHMLFYIWGHSYELGTEKDWSNMEELCSKIGNIDSVWYATNIEIYEYMTALKQLRFFADNSKVYNPTDLDLWIDVDGKCIEVPKQKEISL